MKSRILSLCATLLAALAVVLPAAAQSFTRSTLTPAPSTSTALAATTVPAAPAAPVQRDVRAAAGFTPFMLSFVSPLQVPPRDFDVAGLRISLIYGECRNFEGLDIGVVGRTDGAASGLQIGAIANIVQGDGLGLQIATVNAVKGEYDGLQIGAANYVDKGQAFQVGVYNGARHIEGCQIGLINTTKTMSGIQIGLINVIQDNDVPFIPVINGYF